MFSLHITSEIPEITRWWWNTVVFMFVCGRGSSAIKGLSVKRFAAFPPLPQPIARLPLTVYRTGSGARHRYASWPAANERPAAHALFCSRWSASPFTGIRAPRVLLLLLPGIALCFNMLQYEGRRGGFWAFGGYVRSWRFLLMTECGWLCLFWIGL